MARSLTIVFHLSDSLPEEGSADQQLWRQQIQDFARVLADKITNNGKAEALKGPSDSSSTVGVNTLYKMATY